MATAAGAGVADGIIRITAAAGVIHILITIITTTDIHDLQQHTVAEGTNITTEAEVQDIQTTEAQITLTAEMLHMQTGEIIAAPAQLTADFKAITREEHTTAEAEMLTLYAAGTTVHTQMAT